ncbi:MAG TPA: stage III sporulation protein D [Ruminococcaceae bacterium]|nr:stage III sporulation protein D [Oscillospiraceae bacterium]
MEGRFDERAVTLARYIIENNATVRAAAGKFGVSKSTVHKDVSSRLRRINPALYRRVRVVLDQNKSERHLRGGLATKRKYELKNAARAKKELFSRTALVK